MKQDMNVPAPNGPTGDEDQEIEAGTPEAAGEKGEDVPTVAEVARRRMEEEAARFREAMEVMKEGRGVLALETPITAGEDAVTELAYDFTVITGTEYTDAMDSDSRGNPQNMNSLTYRQALNLFATAAAKEVDGLDMKDIITRMGVTDAVEAVQLATLFFTASTRAGRKRISRRS